MDPCNYKDVTVHGVNYHYYRTYPTSTYKPNLFLIHGFPSTSEHWVHQVSHFAALGYGIIAPDMLGYGGTSKPENPKAYRMTTIAHHCAALLDAEEVEKAVIIAHDWGSGIASKLANLYPERHLATVFLSTGYYPPRPGVRTEATIQWAKNDLKKDIFSYWKFFGSQAAPNIIAAHIDSLYKILFTSDPSLWDTHMTPEGALEKFLLNDGQVPVGSWAPDKEHFDQVFKAGGWLAPTNYYRSLIQDYLMEEDETIPKDRYNIDHPVLVVVCLRDGVNLPILAKETAKQHIKNVTIREVDAGHWLMLEKPHEVNAIIEEFFQKLN